MHRRTLLKQLSACAVLSPLPLFAAPVNGQRLAQAARASRAQLGVTPSYDPNYTRVTYPNRDVPRKTGICADAI